MAWKSSKVSNKHLKSWRKRLDLSVPEAARGLGLGETTYRFYERGERPDSNGKKLDKPKKVRIPKMLAMACLAYEHLSKDLFVKMGITIERKDDINK